MRRSCRLLEAGVLERGAGGRSSGGAAPRIATELSRFGSHRPVGTSSRRLASCRPIRPRRCARCCSRSSPIRGSSSSSSRPAASAAREQRRTDQPSANASRCETREIYAPLANRLGVWQLKWELEDLSFRYLDPENYKRVAGWLAAKRADRERYIDEVIALLHERAREGRHRGRRRRPAQTHLQHLAKNAAQGPVVRSALRHSRRTRPRRLRSPTATRRSASCTACGRTFPVSSTTTSRRRKTTCTARCTPRSSAQASSRSKSRSARAKCTSTPSSASRPTGATRKVARRNPAYEQKIVWLRQILEPAERDERNRRRLSRARALGGFRRPRLCPLTARRSRRFAARRDTARFCLSRAYRPRASLPRRQGQRPHGAAESAAAERRSGGDRHRQAAESEPRLARALARLPRLTAQSQQGARPGFASSTRNRTASRANKSSNANCSAWRSTRVTLPELISEFDLANADAALSRYRRRRDQRRADHGRHPAARQAAGAALARRAPPDGRAQRKRRASRSKASAICSRTLRVAAARYRPSPSPDTSRWGAVSASIARTAPTSTTRGAYSPNASSPPNGARPRTSRSRSTSTYALSIGAGSLRDISAVLADSKINIHAMNTVTSATDGIADMNLKITVHDLEELSRVLARIQGLPNVLSVRRRA